jgi:hypothetical protein
VLEVTPYECHFASLGAPCDGAFTLRNNSNADLTVDGVSLERGVSMFALSQARPRAPRWRRRHRRRQG